MKGTLTRYQWIPAAVVVFLASLPPRLLALRREFWVDEATQAIHTLRPGSFEELRQSVDLHGAPILDFALRKYFWFPVLGHQELALRLPSLFYSLCSIAIAGIVAYRVLRTQVSSLYSTLAALVCALWCAGQSQEIYYA